MLSVVGYVIWPMERVLGQNIWLPLVPESLGDLIVFLVLAVTGILGFGITVASSIRLSELAIGGVLAYVFWMVLLSLAFSEMLLAYLAYGLVLIGVLLGSLIGTVIARRPKG